MQHISSLLSRPLPERETNRLFLTRFKREFVKDMFEYASLPEVCKFLAWTPHLNSEESEGALIYKIESCKNGTAHEWAVVDKKSRKYIGTCGFSSVDTVNNSAEIGYVLSPVFQHCGLMSEAVSELLFLGFDYYRFHRLTARVMDGNISSDKLLRRFHFTYEGLLRESMIIKGNYESIRIYSLLASEWNAMQK